MEHGVSTIFFHGFSQKNNAQETMDLSFQKTCFLSKNHQCLSLELTIRIYCSWVEQPFTGVSDVWRTPILHFSIDPGPAWLLATGKISVPPKSFCKGTALQLDSRLEV